MKDINRKRVAITDCYSFFVFNDISFNKEKRYYYNKFILYLSYINNYLDFSYINNYTKELKWGLNLDTTL